LHSEAVFNSTAETLGQITHHLEAARRFQTRRKRSVVGDDTIDHRVRARQLDLDRAVPSVKTRMPRGICHELVDSQCKAPAPFRFERQGVGHECQTYAIRLEGPADSESERANAFSGIDQPAAIWEAQNAMNLRMLLQQIDDITQRDLYVPILGTHGGGRHNVDQRDEFVVHSALQRAQKRSFIAIDRHRRSHAGLLVFVSGPVIDEI